MTETDPKLSKEPLEAHCIICTEEIKYFAVGPCSHHICLLCSLRLRALYKTTQCSYCKTEQPKVIYSSTNKNFSDYEEKTLKWKDEKLAIYCDEKKIYDHVIQLLQFNCPYSKCSKVCANGWEELKKHAKSTHGRVFCDVCIQHKKAFAHEQFLFTEKELTTHYQQGDQKDFSFKGHPMCDFCKKYFYGKDELFEHCRQSHENCFLCKRVGILDVYYEHYNALEVHFKEAHYLCMEKECLEKKFVVFESDIDLYAHEVEEHPLKVKKGKSQPIELNFQYTTRSSRQSSTVPNQKRSGSQNNLNQNLIETMNNSRMNDRIPPGFGSQLTASPKEAIQNEFNQSVKESKSSLEMASSISGDPDIIKRLQILLESNESKYDALKCHAKSFRSGTMSAQDFLSQVMTLCLEGKHPGDRKAIEMEVGRLWMRFMDTLPETQPLEQTGKSKKKAMSIPLGPNQQGQITKKDEMLRAWNQYKAKNNVDIAWETRPMSSQSNSSQQSLTQSHRILVIKPSTKTTPMLLSKPKPGKKQFNQSVTLPTTAWAKSSMPLNKNQLTVNDFPELPPTTKSNAQQEYQLQERISNIELEDSNTSNHSKKKGKKKTVLMHFG